MYCNIKIKIKNKYKYINKKDVLQYTKRIKKKLKLID